MIFILSLSWIFHSETSTLLVNLELYKFRPFLGHWARIEGSLACSCCDMGAYVIKVVSEDPRHSHLVMSILQWNYHYLFYRHETVTNPEIRTRPCECVANPLSAAQTLQLIIFYLSTSLSSEFQALIELHTLYIFWRDHTLITCNIHAYSDMYGTAL